MIKILVVEDNRDDLELFRRRLDQHVGRFDIHWARDIKTGLEKIEKADCVFLDLRLPDADGRFSSMEAFSPFCGYKPVIVLTGEGDLQVGLHCLSLGAQDFLEKRAAISSDALWRAITFSMQRNSFRQQLVQKKDLHERASEIKQDLSYLAGLLGLEQADGLAHGPVEKE